MNLSRCATEVIHLAIEPTHGTKAGGSFLQEEAMRGEGEESSPFDLTGIHQEVEDERSRWRVDGNRNLRVSELQSQIQIAHRIGEGCLMGILAKPKAKLKIEHCIHIDVRICDSGYSVPESRRDIGLECKACGTIWDVELKGGSDEATIHPRVKRNPK